MGNSQEVLIKSQTERASVSTPSRRRSSFPIDYSELAIFKDVSPLEWEDWHWQIKNSIHSKDQLSQIIQLTPQEQEGIRRSKGRLAVSIPPYWSTLMDPEDAQCVIRRQAVPSDEEFKISPHEMVDPCAEDRDSAAPGLVHRYPDRVLLLATEQCAMYCRHCTRRRMVGEKDHKPFDLKKSLDYIRSNRKVRDVLISGGDPFMLEDEKLEEILQQVREISHVEFLRIGTRIPVTLPQRITENLARILKKYGPIWISLHFNHPREITKRVRQAIEMLADYGIPLGSQTVLLKGINDKPYIMRKLMHELLKIRVRPYYIYQCDPVKGTAHFRTPVATGINIIEKLRGHTSGYAVPTYVVDAPGGGGKIPVSPNYLLSQDKGKYILRNYKGKMYTYIE